MLKLPNSLVEIGDEAFRGCENLRGRVIIPMSCETLGKAVFAGTHLGDPEESAEGENE